MLAPGRRPFTPYPPVTMPPMPYDVAILGAGYVGVPLGQVFAEAGLDVALVDVVPERVEALNRGESYIEDVSAGSLRPLVEAGRIRATTDYDLVRDADAVLIALAT